jgi:hypothetical protein
MAAETPFGDGLQSPAIRARRILLITAGCVGLVFASIGGLALIYKTYAPGQRAAPPRVFPEPRLAVDEAAQRADLEARQRTRLSNYRWIDRQAGIIGIPIERAMELIAQRGSGAYEPLAHDASATKAPP